MKTKITTVLFVAALAAGTASAQAVSGAGRDAFLKQQAVAEMQRVSAQVDVLATNQEELSDRIRRYSGAFSLSRPSFFSRST